MSAFLGPIHYWLYNKIIVQEELTSAISDLSVKNGWINADAAAEFAVAEIPALETVIDTDNIHGWLQERINLTETRYAELVSAVLTDDADNRMEQITAAAMDFGKDHAVQTGSTAEDAYKIMDSTFLNGMPCDRVNVVVGSSPEEVSWEQTINIHEKYWIQAETDPDRYTQIKAAMMQGMLEGSGLKLIYNQEGKWTINRKQ